MKLLFCKQCQDIIRLRVHPRSCECGATSGHYVAPINAVYSGPHAVPLGIANDSLLAAIHYQPQTEGLGPRFTTFVIPTRCATFEQA